MNGNGQYALVTGATSGIGYELANLLSRDGYNLIIVARNESELLKVSTELREKYHNEVWAISKDLFKPDNAFALYNEIDARNIEVEILINDAGQGQFGKFIETDIVRELAIINLNVASLVILTKLFLKDMVARGSGKILNLSSIASKTPGPWQSVYHGTKAFVQSFTEAVRSEVKDTGVTITALLPGATATDFFNKANMKNSKVVQEGKLGSAADVAKDGYRALMKNDDMVISGLKNKMRVAMTNVTSDSRLADKMKKNQAPVNKVDQ